MKKLFLCVIIIFCCIFCFSCKKKSEHNYVECEICKNENKTKIEQLYKSHDYVIEKIIINDTLVSYIMISFSHNGHTHGGNNINGMIKLN